MGKKQEETRWYQSTAIEKSTRLTAWVVEWFDNLMIKISLGLCLVAFARISITMMQLNVYSARAILSLVSLTTFVYLFDRLLYDEEDEENYPSRVAFIKEYTPWLWGLAGVALAVHLYIIGRWLLFPAMASGAYTLAIQHTVGANVMLIASLFYKPIKDRFLLNSAVVAIAWTGEILYLTVAFTGFGGISRPFLLLGGVWMCREIADVELANVRDVEGDRQANKSTLATKFGASFAQHSVFGLDLLAFALLSFALGSFVPLVVMAAYLGIVYWLPKGSHMRLTLLAHVLSDLLALSLVSLLLWGG